MATREPPESGTGGGGDPAAGVRLGGEGGGQGVRLGPGSEFDLIRSYLGEGSAPREDVAVGPGDDAAVVRGSGIVLTTDLSIEDTHYRRAWLSPFHVGYRAATAALSDLAAMAARPIGVLASIALSPADAHALSGEIMRGVEAAAARVGGVLLGGDLTSTTGPVVIDIVGVGEARDPVLRSGALPGDELWVTGSLGGAALTVDLLLRREEPPAAAFERFRLPVARIAEAAWLRDKGIAAAMLDLSDGLGGDAAHLAAASGVAIVIEGAAVPVDPAVAAAVSPEHALRLALSGGEDYELCFAARPGAVADQLDAFRDATGCSLTRVGLVEVGEGVHLRLADGTRTPLLQGGFQHFRDSP